MTLIRKSNGVTWVKRADDGGNSVPIFCEDTFESAV